ncbi:MAG: hypothetical protein JO115_22980 [Pseudonocardiales bacterium]|nr:hypothetical protein [Pseudonocardiales bacterium]
MRSSRKATTPTPVNFRIGHNELRTMLYDAMKAATPTDRCSVEYRASAALHDLLAAHPVDQQGRCELCRNPGTRFGSRRPFCLIYQTARCWLRQV